MKRNKLLALLLALAMILSLCACGSQTTAPTGTEPAAGDASQAAPEGGDSAPQEPPEPTPEPGPKTFMDEHGLEFSLQLSCCGTGQQWANSGSDYLTPDNCAASVVLVSLDRSDPDEEGYVTYTLVSEGEVHPGFVYTDADGDKEKNMGCSGIGYSIIDRYTGTEFPGRSTMNDDAYDYSVSFDWGGQSYTVNRTYTIWWDGWLDIDRGSGMEYYHITDVVRIPADYDGLCLAWYEGEPEQHDPEDEKYELDLEEAHLFCEDDFSALSDFCFVGIEMVEAALGGGGTEALAPAAPDGQISDADYKEKAESLIGEIRMNGDGDRYFFPWNERHGKDSFVLRGGDVFYYFGSNYFSPWTYDRDKGIWVGDGPYPESVDVIDGFMLENRSKDRQIAIKAFDEKGNLIGCSGLLGPNEYLTSFALDTPGKVRQVVEYTVAGNMDFSEKWLEGKLYNKPAFTMMLCIYDMEGNLLSANSVENLLYGNGYITNNGKTIWSEYETPKN